jgi:hypothetical protein
VSERPVVAMWNRYVGENHLDDPALRPDQLLEHRWMFCTIAEFFITNLKSRMPSESPAWAHAGIEALERDLEWFRGEMKGGTA